MSATHVYHAIARFRFSRRDGPWDQHPVHGPQQIAQVSQTQEKWLEDEGVFRWYRNQVKGKDPRRVRKGHPHAFGAVPLILTAAEARDFRQKFRGSIDLISDRSARLPPRRSAALLGESKPAFEAGDLWHLRMTRADTAHAAGIQGQGVTVAVVDSGIDANHPEFSTVSITSRRFHSETGADLGASNGDSWGHGTAVAALIAGLKGGVAPKASLLDVKVFDSAKVTIGPLLKALEFVAKRPKVKVVNLSFGCDGPEPGMETILNRLLELGILPVCSSGKSSDRVGSPGDFDAVLTVGSTDNAGKVNADSGSLTRTLPTGETFTLPDAVAPGAGVFAAVPGGKVGEHSGTSFACAVASGLAALYLSNPISPASPQPPANVRDLMARMLFHTSAVQPSARGGRGLLHFAG
jgi:subtilisin family serine protease